MDLRFIAKTVNTVMLVETNTKSDGREERTRKQTQISLISKMQKQFKGIRKDRFNWH